MAPESESRLNGTSPSNKSIKSVSDSSFTEVQGFLEALTAFTTKAGFNQLKTLFDRVTLQEQELEAKDATIRGMTLNFEQRYQEWKKENEDLRRGTQAMDAALKEKEERKKALNDELRKTTTRVNHLEEAHNVATVTLKNKDLQLGHLEAKFQTAKKASDDLKERLKKADGNAAALTESLENGANENRKLQLEATKSEKLIKEYRGFAKTLEELDLRDIKSQLESLWKSAATLIMDVVGRDLPNRVLEANWAKLNDNEVFRNYIPLPQNNSNIAKQMRVAVVLGILASLVGEFLFQPTYVLDERSGLQELLRRQAAINPWKEMYTRGILLSMPHDDQEDIDMGMIESIMENLDEIADVFFTPKDDFVTFAKELGELLLEFQKQWKRVQLGREKLEPSLHRIPSLTNYPWYVVDLPAATNAKKRTSSPPTTNNAQDGIIIIPQVVHIRTEGDPAPVTHGWVLQSAHIHAADEEKTKIDRSLRTAPRAEEAPERTRTRRRGKSTSANGHSDKRKRDSFLS